MGISTKDRKLLTRVRKATGAQNESQLPPEVLEQELERAKEELTDELRQSLESGTYNFYAQKEPEELLFNFLCLRAKSLEDERKPRTPGKPRARLPKTVSSARRFDYEDSQMNFWRDEVVRRLNRITE